MRAPDTWRILQLWSKPLLCRVVEMCPCWDVGMFLLHIQEHGWLSWQHSQCGKTIWVVSQWLLQGLFQKLPHLTCECRPWHCSCGTCSVGSNVRGAEPGIYLDGEIHWHIHLPFRKLCQVFLQTMWWVVVFCEVLRRAWYHLQTLTSGCSWSLVHRWQTSWTISVPGQTPGNSLRTLHQFDCSPCTDTFCRRSSRMPLSKLRPCPLFKNFLFVSGDADVVRCRIPSRNRGRWHQRVCCASRPLQMFNASNKCNISDVMTISYLKTVLHIRVMISLILYTYTYIYSFLTMSISRYNNNIELLINCSCPFFCGRFGLIAGLIQEYISFTTFSETPGLIGPYINVINL